MKLLEGKKAVVYGVANKRSIAWGITKALKDHGAEVGISYANEAMGKRAIPLAEEQGIDFVDMCDVTSDDEIAKSAAKAKEYFGEVDIMVHAIAFANRNELKGAFHNTSRAGFHLAMDISVFSYVALVNAYQSFTRPGGSMMTLSYYGGVKVMPNYNIMGVAKAALESSTRYLAWDLGPKGIRVNTISAGPVRTLAAAGVGKFKELSKSFISSAPLKEEITIEDVGGAAVYLASDLSKKVTGDVLYVDSGYNIMGITEYPEDVK
jgi:enoyl-[acyl-carrier protein] reductase I